MNEDYICLEDGFYYFWPRENKGCFAPYELRRIAAELDALNEPLQNSIEEYFEQQTQNPVVEEEENFPF